MSPPVPAAPPARYAAADPAPPAAPPAGAPLPKRVPQMAAASSAAIALPAPSRWGAVYLAAAPATEFGLTVGVADRLAAHAQAQTDCAARGAPCRAALEFSDRCGAVAQARRTLGLFRTADPRTFSVSYAAAGAGPTREVAESAALAECRARERSTGCEIAASACGRP
jgi:hypothetical protein